MTSPDELRGLLDEAERAAFETRNDWELTLADTALLGAVKRDLSALLDRLTLLEAERERLREALEPFAAICPAVEKTKARDGNVCHRQFLDDGSRVELTIADFQRARSAYAALPQGEG